VADEATQEFALLNATVINSAVFCVFELGDVGTFCLAYNEENEIIF